MVSGGLLLPGVPHLQERHATPSARPAHDGQRSATALDKQASELSRREWEHMQLDVVTTSM